MVAVEDPVSSNSGCVSWNTSFKGRLRIHAGNIGRRHGLMLALLQPTDNGTKISVIARKAPKSKQ